VARERLRRQIRKQSGHGNSRTDQDPVDDAQTAQTRVALR
jgi:hypothetical protein